MTWQERLTERRVRKMYIRTNAAEEEPGCERWRARGAGFATGGVLGLTLLVCWLGLQRGHNLEPYPALRRLARKLSPEVFLNPTGATAPELVLPPLNPAAAKYPDIAEICSAEYRRKNAEEVEGGKDPAVIQWACNLPTCPGHAVWWMIAGYRQRQLRDFLDYVPCDLYKLIQGRTVWIVGDSQAQGFYRQLRCYLEPLLEKVPTGEKPRHDHYITGDPEETRIINERILKGYDGGVEMPFCTYYVGATRVCHVRVNMAYHFVDDYLPNLHLFNVSRSDILTFNFGLWHHKQENTYPGLIQRLADYVAANSNQLPMMIWRDNSPQHFDIMNGEYPHPNEADKFLKYPYICKPMEDVMLVHDGTLWGKNEHVKRGGWRNIISTPIMQAAGIPILDTWNETVPLWEMHDAERHECTHFCTPGGYSIWVWKLWMLLRRLPPPPLAADYHPAWA